MAFWSRDRDERKPTGPMLVVEGLDVYYGRAHALQGVALHASTTACFGIVGRNGMGKTTLCNAITGLVRASGSVKLAGEEILGLRAERDHAARHRLRAAGAARLAVASGRRDAAPGGAAQGATSTASTRCSRAWPNARANGGAQLSGGEQQMLAIGRALLLNPRLLVMDEPTEGLAPVIVEQVERVAAPARRRGRDRGAADRAEPRRRDRRWPIASA